MTSTTPLASAPREPLVPRGWLAAAISLAAIRALGILLYDREFGSLALAAAYSQLALWDVSIGIIVGLALATRSRLLRIAALAGMCETIVVASLSTLLGAHYGDETWQGLVLTNLVLWVGLVVALQITLRSRHGWLIIATLVVVWIVAVWHVHDLQSAAFKLPVVAWVFGDVLLVARSTALSPVRVDAGPRAISGRGLAGWTGALSVVVAVTLTVAVVNADGSGVPVELGIAGLLALALALFDVWRLLQATRSGFWTHLGHGLLAVHALHIVVSVVRLAAGRGAQFTELALLWPVLPYLCAGAAMASRARALGDVELPRRVARARVSEIVGASAPPLAVGGVVGAAATPALATIVLVLAGAAQAWARLALDRAARRLADRELAGTFGDDA